MICKNCNREISNDAKFCPYCGKEVEPDNFEETASSEVELPNGGETANRKKAWILTLIIGILGLLFLLISLLFGIGVHYILLAAVFIGLFIYTKTCYSKVEVTQSDLNNYNAIYGGTADKPSQNGFASLSEVKGFNRQTVYLIGIGKKSKAFKGFLCYMAALMGLIGGIVFPITGLAGFGVKLDGVYVQSTASHSGGGVDQVGKTAYKIEGDLIYFSGYYEGDSTAWGSGMSYTRTGSKVTYHFNKGGMSSYPTLYFVNLGNNIASDKFGFDVQFTKVK